jgi:flagellar biosynthesis protein FlhF
MNIERYVAPDMRRAIHLVRTEHGPDAVILSSESVDGGVEIIAAVGYDQALVARAFGRPAKAEEAPTGETGADGAKPSTESAADAASSATPAASAPTENTAAPPAARKTAAATSFVMSMAGASAKAAAASAEPAPSPAREKPTAPATTANSPAPAETLDIETTRELRAIQKDLFALKGLVRERFAWSDLRALTPQRSWLMRRAEDFGLTAELADIVVAEVEHPESDDRAWRELLFALARRLSVMREDPLDQGGVFALVGPTGVGKTTTIAKLAARHCVRHGRDSLALITTDFLRIGAHRQLEAFAAILGVPVRTADSPERLARLLAEMGDRRLVLIDTAGNAAHDSAITGALKALETGAKLKRFLALAANTQATFMSDAVRAFGGRDLSGIVLTKLDETSALGAAISVLVESKLPAVWLSDGQRVPEDLKLARVAELLKRATAVDESGQHRVVPAFAAAHATANDRGRIDAAG